MVVQLLEGKYTFIARIASEVNNSSISIFNNNEIIIKAIDLPNTGGSQIWQDIQLGKVNLLKGNQLITVRINRGGANLKILEIKSEEASQGVRIFEYQIYPNPMSEKINIDFSSLVNTQITISIYDLKGYQIWRKRVNSGVSQKHLKKRSPEINRFKCSRQKAISGNRISKR